MGGKILYSKKYNVEYYNITKCGMTSISQSLAIAMTELSEAPSDRKIFTVIRNPLDRFLSSFLHCYRVYSPNFGSIRKLNKTFINKDISLSFDLFLTEIEVNGFFDSHNTSQMWFLDNLVTKTITTPRKFESITDFILFEDMDIKLKELVGDDTLQIKKLNIGNGSQKKTLKSKVEANRDRIIKLYSEDWDLYQKLLNGSR